jgi:8-hydroxy-5-deazaflavin:NADPH oxidoreductase
MKIAVLGTGMVGQAIAGRLAELGHEVTAGTRDAEATMARTEPDGMGNPPFSAWASAHPAVRLATFAAAAGGADLVVNATSGEASMAALNAAGADNLAGKVLLDVANALDFSRGFPPRMAVTDTNSLAEQIQAAFPQARVVKSLNTMAAIVMVNPELVSGGDHSVFVSGNDAEAKKIVTGLLESFGHRDIIDLGDISTARGTEMLMPIWLRLMGALGSPMFNFKIAR